MLIKGSDYRPRFKFFQHRSKNFPENLHMGFEWEFNRKGREFNSYSEPRLNLPDLFYLKHDGSCDVELVTHPFNWPYYLKNINSFNKWYDNVLNISQSTTNCGFHVHFSKKYFTVPHVQTIFKFMFAHREFFKKISGRSNESISSYANLYEVGDDCVKNSYNGGSDKFHACHITPSTVEFRLFKSTLDKKKIHAYLEFYMAFIEFTKQMTKNKRSSSYIKSPDALKHFKVYVCKNYDMACLLMKKKVKKTKKKVAKRKKK